MTARIIAFADAIREPRVASLYVTLRLARIGEMPECVVISRRKGWFATMTTLRRAAKARAKEALGG